MNVLRTQDVCVDYRIRRTFGLSANSKTPFRAVNHVSLKVEKGKTLGVVGESGCGKSTLGRAMLGLYPVTSGKVFFKDQELTRLWKGKILMSRPSWSRELRDLRRNMQMIFQDPYSSLNPRMTIEEIIAEPVVNFGLMKERELEAWVRSLMQKVGLDPGSRRRYPHEFSGGQRQRVGIARALAIAPEVIVADEPVSALDVSVQAQILNLLMDLKNELKLTMVFISHDISAVSQICDDVAVMYRGKIVEQGSVNEVCKAPKHPYTELLLSSISVPNPVVEKARLQRGQTFERVEDEPTSIGGCPFYSRCPVRISKCREEDPKLQSFSDESRVSCWACSPSTQ